MVEQLDHQDWLAYATSVLEKAGEEVELCDFPAMGWDKIRLRQLIQEKQPQFCCLRLYYPFYLLRY